MENVIEDIKAQVYSSIEKNKTRLLNLKKETYDNKWTDEYDKVIRETKYKIILESNQYTLEKYSQNNIDQTPSQMIIWITEEVNNRFDCFKQQEEALRNAQGFF